MSEQFYTILTNIGKAKIANAISLGSEVNLVRFIVGDSNGSYYNPTEEQTELRRKVWETNAISVVNDEKNPNWIKIEAIIPGDVGEFTVREVCVFDDKNEMIAIGKIAEIYKPISENGSTKDVIIRMIMEVSNASAVTIKVDPTVMIATKKDIEVVESKFKKITGDKNELVTKDKSNLVAAINEVSTDLGNIELTGNKVSIEDTDNNFVSGTVEGALKELATKDKDLDKRIGNNKDEIDRLKLSVADGKSKIATSVSGKGVPTNGSDPFQTMADNIDSIIVRSPIADDEIGVVQWEDGSYKGFKELDTYKVETSEDRTMKSYNLNRIAYMQKIEKIENDYIIYCCGYTTTLTSRTLSKVLLKTQTVIWDYISPRQIVMFDKDNFGNLYLLTIDSFVIKLDNNGKLVWEKQIRLNAQSSIVNITCHRNGFLYAGTTYDDNNYYLFKIDPSNGEILITKTYSRENRYRVSIMKSGRHDNYIYAYVNDSTTGRNLFKFDENLNEINRFYPVVYPVSDFFVGTDDMYYILYGSGVGKYNAAGTELWRSGTGTPVSIMMLDDFNTCYVTRSDFMLRIDSKGRIILPDYSDYTNRRIVDYIAPNLFACAYLKDADTWTSILYENIKTVEVVTIKENYNQIV